MCLIKLKFIKQHDLKAFNSLPEKSAIVFFPRFSMQPAVSVNVIANF